MKDGIRHIMFHGLRNEEHFGFHSEFATLVKEFSLSEAFLALVAIYNDRYDELDVTMEVLRRSSISRQLAAADNQRTASYRRLRSAVRGHLRYAESAKIEAALRINDLIWQYGDLAKVSLDKKTYGLTNLLQDLNEKNSADLQLLGLTAWVSELEAKNQLYKKLKVSRYEEWEKRPSKTVRECRDWTDAAYHSIIRQLMVHGELNPADENFVLLVTALNERVNAYNRLSAQRSGIMEARRELAAETSSSSSSSSVAMVG